MSQSHLSNYSAWIKEVYIELRNYKFYHSPYSKELEEGRGRFIGRKSVKNRIKLILKRSETKSGAYLVTGFRGMGKTSVVREAINEYNIEILGPNYKSFYREDYLIKNFYQFIAYFFGISAIYYFFSADVLSVIPYVFIVLILLAFLTLNEKNEKILKAVWNFFKLLFLTLVFLGFILYVLNPDKFCLEYKCLQIPAKWPQFLEEGKHLVLRTIIGLVVGYCFISLIFFLTDLIRLFGQRIKNWTNRKIESQTYEPIEINLSQDALIEEDILKRITKEILIFWLSKKQDYSILLFERKIYYPWQWILTLLNIKKKKVSPDYTMILNRLINLSFRINGEVTTQRELNITPNVNFSGSSFLENLSIPLGNFTNRDQVAYPLASPKQIEDELIEIFRQIHELRYVDKQRTLEGKHDLPIPNFLFIIDELDKIEPHSSVNLEERELSNPSLDSGINAPGTSKYRQRQEAVASLLGNLKGFLNVVRAKFFFIAGREMFDADLADIADRDSFYSSIFNDVIYVNSFFKDQIDQRAGITQMAEAYLCNIILSELKGGPSSSALENKQKNSLENLATSIKVGEKPYLTFHSKSPNKGSYSTQDKVQQYKKFKIIHLLQNYIIYLIYRSNGSPKKLASLTEKIIEEISFEKKKINDDKGDFFKFCTDNLVVLQDESVDKLGNWNKKSSVFLRFTFEFQYEIGLTANLYRPYLTINSRHIKNLGDKLLFSSAFIIDHILKFHPFGFSWRNLELIPEVILVNKEPSLRRFVEEIIRFLSSTYIRSTVGGIFQYRFYSRISRELMFLSKTSALASAAFNFTLDESLQIKRHYKKKLIELRNKYKDYTPISGDNQFVHSLCFIQTILGDLYFYDKEYDEALLYYTESIQPLRTPNAINEGLWTRHQFFLWLRNKLKLGLTLEKMRAYNSSFSYYRTLMLDTHKYLQKLFPGFEESDPENKVIQESEDHRTIHMISMPFVAFLGILEKARNDGITYFNLKMNAEEFIRIIYPEKERVPSSEKRLVIGDEYRRNLLLADYYNNIGSILFFKNCQFPKLYEERNYILRSLNKSINNQLKELYGRNKEINKKNNQVFDYHPSFSAFNYFWEALHYLITYHKKRLKTFAEDRFKSINLKINLKQENYLALTPVYLLPECIDLINAKRFYYLANVISKIGDACLGSLHRDDFRIPNNWSLASDEFFINKPFEKDIIGKNVKCMIKQFNKIIVGKGDTKMFSVKSILLIYQLAGALYLRAGRSYSYAFQLKKILYLIKDLIAAEKDRFENKELNKELVEKISIFLDVNESKTEPFQKIESLAIAIFRSSTWNYEVSNRPQILKYRKILHLQDKLENRDIIYNNINNATDIREAIFAVESIKLKCASISSSSFSKKVFSKNSYDFLITPYGNVNNKYCRILELKYRTEWCYFIMNEVLNAKWFLNNSFENNEIDLYTFSELSNIKNKARKENSLVVVYHSSENKKSKSSLSFVRRSANIVKNKMPTGKPQTLSENNIKETIQTFFSYLLAKQNNDFVSFEKILLFLIKESIFSLRQLIRMIRLFEPGYVIGYSYLAEAHRRMGAWSQAYENLIFYYEQTDQEEKKKFFLSELKIMIGKYALDYLEANNHYELAQQNYYKTIQMHTEGRAYKAHVLNLYCLEDDYNENLTHFNIAAERLRVNTEDIRKKLARLKEKTDQSRLYQYDSYFPQETEKRDRQKIDKNMRILEEVMEWKFT